MKQTITILSALAAALLIASGFIVAANVDLCRDAAENQQELSQLRTRLADTQQLLERSTQENSAVSETLQKTIQEREALSQQLSEAVTASQQASDAVARQISENEQVRLQLEALQADYQEMLQACAALEAQIADLGEQAAQTALSSEQQALADAMRIAELEAALEEALRPTPAPTAQPPARRTLQPPV